MSDKSLTPDLSSFEIPIDVWSEPFWKATAERRLVMPRCCNCGTFRWPAGPFCPRCRTQAIDWLAPGQGRIHSYTVLPGRQSAETGTTPYRIPVLVVFDDAPGVRLVTTLIDADSERVEIGQPVEVEWLPAANATVPVFRLTP